MASKLNKDVALLQGDAGRLEASLAALAGIPVDRRHSAGPDWKPDRLATTIGGSCEVRGPATYEKGRTSVLSLRPGTRPGWYFERLDLPDQLPILVSPRNVRSARRSIVLRSGCPDNLVRMTEHIVCQRLGLGLDRLVVGMRGSDPPLFDAGSAPLAEAIRSAGIAGIPGCPLTYWTVRRPVAVMNRDDGFLLFEPAPERPGLLSLDVAIDFPNAIGRQRIQFDLDRTIFGYAAQARTNCSAGLVLLTKTIGRLFADTRSLGYDWNNILVAGRRRYLNRPAMLEDGKSLEAVWHRACLDLLAALSLLEDGRLCGRITSYKAGHALDVQLMTLLLKHDLLETVRT